MIKLLHHNGVLLVFLADGCVAQALGLGDALLDINDPAISGIHTKDAAQIVQWWLRTCEVHCDW